MRVRVIALLLAGGVLLGACSSGGSSSSKPSVDPNFKALVDTGTALPGSDSSPATTDSTDTSGTSGTPAAPDLSKYDVDCIRREVKKGVDEGKYGPGDVVLWMQGLTPDGPVSQAVTEIGNSGVCNK